MVRAALSIQCASSRRRLAEGRGSRACPVGAYSGAAHPTTAGAAAAPRVYADAAGSPIIVPAVVPGVVAVVRGVARRIAAATARDGTSRGQSNENNQRQLVHEHTSAQMGSDPKDSMHARCPKRSILIPMEPPDMTRMARVNDIGPLRRWGCFAWGQTDLLRRN